MDEIIKGILEGNAPVLLLIVVGIVWLRSELSRFSKKIDAVVSLHECERIHEEVNRRLTRIEDKENGL